MKKLLLMYAAILLSYTNIYSQVLWGLTLNGGVWNSTATSGYGQLVVYNPANNTFSSQYSFSSAQGTSPCGTLLMGTDGNIYGTTNDKGGNNNGTIWKFNPATSTFTKIHDFTNTTGKYTHSDLMQAQNGKIYGVAEQGGANNQGTLFELNPTTGVVTTLVDFSIANGFSPFCMLHEVSPGKLIGTTKSGGANSNGVIFEYDYTTSTYTKKIDLQAAVTGSEPINGVIKASDGKFYGMMNAGGANSLGVLYQYDHSTNTLTVKQSFSATTGGNPKGRLFIASDGMMYGLTETNGTNNKGTIIQYDYVNNTLTKKYDFSGTADGTGPNASFVESEGKLYALVQRGGANNGGTIIEYDYASNTFTKKRDFGRTDYGYNNTAFPFLCTFMAQTCASVSITSSPVNTTVCASLDTAFSVTATGSGLTYKWQLKPAAGGAFTDITDNSTYSGSTTSRLVVNDATAGLDGNYYRCVVSSSSSCSNYSSVAKLSVNVVQPIVTPSVSTAITTGSNPGCNGSAVTFTATPTNGGSNPSYQWKVNGSNTGTNSPNFTSSSFTTGDVVSCQMTSDATCVSTRTVLSSQITMSVTASVTPSVTIAVTTGSNPTCSGNAVTFTATPVNGGSSPSFQWKVNGSNAGSNSADFTSTSFADQDAVTCEITSSELCASPATATSAQTLVTVVNNPVPAVSISITSGSNPACSGNSITFKAVGTNGGSTPSYQWKVNGSNVGSNSEMFTTSSLADQDQVTCEMTSSISCASPSNITSNSITMTVNNTVTSSVSIAVTAGSDHICEGTAVELTATPVNGGSSPTYQWKVNNSSSGTGVTFSSAALNDEDEIICIMTSNATCASPVSSTSNTVTMDVTADPGTVTAEANGNTSLTVCEGELVSLSVDNVSGASYSWTGPNSFSSSLREPDLTASVAASGTYTINVSIGNCTSQSTVSVTVNAKPAVPAITANLPAMTLTSSAASGNQWYLYGSAMIGETSQVLSLLAAGSYTVKVTNAQGCTSVSAPYNYLVSGIEDAMNGKLSVYPNPSSGSFKISAEHITRENIGIKITDMYGSEVFSGNLNGGNISEIDIENLSDGVYFIHATQGSLEETIKIIVH